MKITFEPEDADLIANRVIELLMPILKEYLKERPKEELLFSTDTLADYLRVSRSTIYNWVHLKQVPYYKMGKYTRFKKSAIDKWMEEKRIGTNPCVTRSR